MGCSYGAVKGEVSSCGFYCLVVSIVVVFTNDMSGGICLFCGFGALVVYYAVNIESDGWLNGVIRLDGVAIFVLWRSCWHSLLCQYHIS